MQYFTPGRRLSTKEENAIRASLRRHHQRRAKANREAEPAMAEALAIIAKATKSPRKPLATSRKATP